MIKVSCLMVIKILVLKEEVDPMEWVLKFKCNWPKT